MRLVGFTTANFLLAAPHKQLHNIGHYRHLTSSSTTPRSVHLNLDGNNRRYAGLHRPYRNNLFQGIVVVPYANNCYSSTAIASMPRGIKKENLPSKVCTVCQRPFTWRKKWEKVWDEVTTCSKSCNKKRRAEKQTSNRLLLNNDNDNINNKEGTFFERAQETSEWADDVDDPESAATAELFSFPANVAVAEILNTNGNTNNNNERSDEEDSSDNSVTMIPMYGDADHDDPVRQRKAERKAAKKAKKAERRLNRQGRGDPSAGQKECDVCTKSVNLLIRCTIDESARWNMVCGKCWNGVSGGVVDGDASHPYYKYGGLWKNRRAQD